MKKSEEIIIATAAMAIIFLFMEEYYTDQINFLTKYTAQLLRDNLFFGYIFVLFISMPFIYFLVPGMNLFTILVAYFLGDFWLSFTVTFSILLIWITISFFTYEKIFVKKFKKQFKKEIVYKVLKIWNKEGPFKMALLVRQLIIPQFYKNMFLIILKTSYRDYIVSSLICDGSHFLSYVLIGIHVKKIQMSRQNGGFYEFFDWFEIFKITFTTIVLLLNIYFVYATCKRQKQLEKQLKHDEVKIDSDEESDMEKSLDEKKIDQDKIQTADEPKVVEIKSEQLI